jgi:hypothetical protein
LIREFDHVTMRLQPRGMVKRVASRVGEGSMAVQFAHRFLAGY